jgi:hypothetical protein
MHQEGLGDLLSCAEFTGELLEYVSLVLVTFSTLLED